MKTKIEAKNFIANAETLGAVYTHTHTHTGNFIGLKNAIFASKIESQKEDLHL